MLDGTEMHFQFWPQAYEHLRNGFRLAITGKSCTDITLRSGQTIDLSSAQHPEEPPAVGRTDMRREQGQGIRGDVREIRDRRSGWLRPPRTVCQATRFAAGTFGTIMRSAKSHQ